MYEQILELLKANEPAKVTQAVHQDAMPPEVAKRYEQLVLDLYWKAKDLPAVIQMANLGLAYCLTNARKAGDADFSAALFDSAMKIAFNLASFCWPGWDEPGIIVGFRDIQSGADAARLNLRLAEQLKRPPAGLAKAHWMLGNYALAQRNFSQAIKDYTTALDFAEQAEDKLQTLSMNGFHAMAELGDDEKEAPAEFDRILTELESLNTDDSKEYARQLRVARKVFDL